ncbi:hypothetical protein H4R33_006109 [Dimargaris cristalligena]|uniref:Uncharacterized protein n=1 Tax=Dimargaris cristalligena TaxID=215637 RepID=A0A4P9ZW96_9FUNG|nr:hypothetical protein H4R33_006109 [Dimargaris cristalligena]RKP37578.1 hypothetical protein BJ085DRAFT_30354 [Dimargaris cristalligena]|eukprot:RKP37578.1 hypothetical protein BJ085DRAFT_30354 [Dimargaris cristalligena]
MSPPPTRAVPSIRARRPGRVVASRFKLAKSTKAKTKAQEADTLAEAAPHSTTSTTTTTTTTIATATTTASRKPTLTVAGAASTSTTATTSSQSTTGNRPLAGPTGPPRRVSSRLASPSLPVRETGPSRRPMSQRGKTPVPPPRSLHRKVSASSLRGRKVPGSSQIMSGRGTRTATASPTNGAPKKPRMSDTDDGESVPPNPTGTSTSTNTNTQASTTTTATTVAPSTKRVTRARQPPPESAAGNTRSIASPIPEEPTPRRLTRQSLRASTLLTPTGKVVAPTRQIRGNDTPRTTTPTPTATSTPTPSKLRRTKNRTTLKPGSTTNSTTASISTTPLAKPTLSPSSIHNQPSPNTNSFLSTSFPPSTSGLASGLGGEPGDELMALTTRWLQWVFLNRKSNRQFSHRRDVAETQLMNAWQSLHDLQTTIFHTERMIQQAEQGQRWSNGSTDPVTTTSSSTVPSFTTVHRSTLETMLHTCADLQPQLTRLSEALLHSTNILPTTDIAAVSQHEFNERVNQSSTLLVGLESANASNLKASVDLAESVARVAQVLEKELQEIQEVIALTQSIDSLEAACQSLDLSQG